MISIYICYLYFLLWSFANIVNDSLLISTSFQHDNNIFRIPKLRPLFSQSSEDIVFAGVKFSSPISTSLDMLNIKYPTPIQKASLTTVMTGLSCILQAETGTGKTLCFLLPILKRIFSDQNNLIQNRSIKAIIIVPTKELAVQIAADINTLTCQQEGMIELCLNNNNEKPFTSPILIGTPHKLLKAMSSMTSSQLQDLEYLVLDEVDRLLPVVGRYATGEDKKMVRDRQNPCTEVIKRITAVAKDFQVVASSATVGRPLRRELSKLFESVVGKEDGQFHVIRPVVSEKEDKDKVLTRQIGIPNGIKHIALLDSQDSSELSSKLSLAKNRWTKDEKRSRGMLFVPNSDDVRQAIGILKFWGVTEAKDLQQALGLNNENQEGRTTTLEWISLAQQNSIGANSLLGHNSDQRDLFVVPVSGTRGLHIQNIDCVLILKPPRTMDEYLHMVIINAILAGRTGRTGNKMATGTVYSVVTLEELKRLKSWETPLGITFDVQYS